MFLICKYTKPTGVPVTEAYLPVPFIAVIICPYLLLPNLPPSANNSQETYIHNNRTARLYHYHLVLFINYYKFCLYTEWITLIWKYLIYKEAITHVEFMNKNCHVQC